MRTVIFAATPQSLDFLSSTAVPEGLERFNSRDDDIDRSGLALTPGGVIVPT